MLLIGLGAATAFTPLLTIALAHVPARDAGIGSGIVNVSQQVSAALSVAVLGAVSTSRTATLLADGRSVLDALDGGYRLAFIIALASVVVGDRARRRHPEGEGCPAAERSEPGDENRGGSGRDDDRRGALRGTAGIGSGSTARAGGTPDSRVQLRCDRWRRSEVRVAEAVVIGGGPTGLAVAMLLAQQGVGVVVLDRDPPPPGDASRAWDDWDRRSVSQFRQVHFLQPAGRALLEQRLPAVAEQMRAAGVPRYNLAESLARLLPGGPGDVDFAPFDTLTTCRRPVLEFGFAAAAGSCPGVEIRHDSPVVALVTGPEVISGVPHVVGVKTQAGDTVLADVVLDVSGRRTPVPGLLEAEGGRRPPEQSEDLGFVYNTRYYRGPTRPEYLTDPLAAVGSISVLAMPGDDDYWSITLYHSPRDKAMRKVRDPAVFDRVLRSLPLHAHWADGVASDGVNSMASTANTTRQFVVDGQPVATGLLPVGDAWGFTNPSLGRGIFLGLKHAVAVTDAIDGVLDSPAGMAAAWEEATRTDAEPWHEATVQFDRVRGPELEAFRLGLPDPSDTEDPMVAGSRAFFSASHYDAQVLAWFQETASCLSLPTDVVMRPGVFDRILDVAAQNPPYVTPGPDRARLEELLA